MSAGMAGLKARQSADATSQPETLKLIAEALEMLSRSMQEIETRVKSIEAKINRM